MTAVGGFPGTETGQRAQDAVPFDQVGRTALSRLHCPQEVFHQHAVAAVMAERTGTDCVILHFIVQRRIECEFTVVEIDLQRTVISDQACTSSAGGGRGNEVLRMDQMTSIFTADNAFADILDRNSREMAQ